MNITILLVEDNEEIMAINRRALEGAGYSMLAAETLEIAREILAGHSPDLILLDVVMPDGSGLELCREIRDRLSVPILLLTVQSESGQIVNGLSVGADDYIVKPCAPEELVARVQARLREHDRLKSALKESLELGGLKLDITLRRALYRGRDLMLTPKEFALLTELMRRSESYVSVYELYRTIWGMDALEDVRTVYVHISKLRGKLKAAEIDHIRIARDAGQGVRLICRVAGAWEGDEL